MLIMDIEKEENKEMKKSNNQKRLSSMIFDARGNGGGCISPTITGDHQNRITDYTAIIVECFTK